MTTQTDQSPAAAQVARLEERLDALEAKDGVLRTLHRLAQTIDYGAHEQWVDCFTDDAVFEMVEVRGTTRTTKVRHQGAEALAAFIPGHTCAPDYYHKHMTTVPIIEVDRDHASADSYFARIDAGEDGPFLWSFGRYRDQFRRGADGAWRVSRRTLEVESRATPVKASDIGTHEGK